MPEWKDEIKERLASLKLEPSREAAIVEELSQHLDDCYEELLAGGATGAEAERRTLSELSGSELLARELRRVERRNNQEPIILGTNRRSNMIADLWQDLRFGARMLKKQPGFTLIAVVTLALGIGANTAIFSLLDAVLLRPLPVKKPQELALLSPTGFIPASSVGLHGVSYPFYRALRDNNTVFDGALCHFRFPASVSVRGENQRITAELVSGNYFDVLGVGAALGRTLTPDDDRQPGAHPVAVLSHEYWLSAFAGNPAVIGQTIHFNGQPLTIVGVSEKGFAGVELDFRPQVRVPMMMTGSLVPFMNWIGLEAQASRWVEVFGRLKPGITHSQAQVALEPLYRSLVQASIDSGAFGSLSDADKKRFLQSALSVVPGASGTSFLRRDWSTPLWAISAMAGLLLLLTCVNVANLFIGRGVERRGDIAVRLALGGSRARIVRQLFTESFLLVVIGGGAGMWLAPRAAELLVQFLPSTTEGTPNVSTNLNGRILFFSVAVTATAAVLSGLLPALLSIRLDLATVLKQASSRTLPRGRFRQVLVVAQVSLSLLLLFGSGLFVRSLSNLYAVEPGFETRAVVAFGVDPVLNGYSRQQVEEIYRRLKERLETTPGVESAALGLVRLLGGADVWKTQVVIEGQPPASGTDALASFNAVSLDYFRTLGIALRQGRDFRASDKAGAPQVAVVNESFVRRFLGRVDPIGRRFGQTEIIGVAQDSHYESVRGDSPAQVFVPYPQFGAVTGMNGYVRSSLPADQVFALIRRAVREVDPTLPIHAMRAMNEQRDRSLATERVIALLATAFGALATLLAGVGLFGVLNYSVARRARELGLRMALGATGSRVAWLVLKEVLILCAIGLAVALPLAMAMSRLVASQLHGVAPADPRTAAAATMVLVFVAVIAAAIPARRAAKVDPMVALRSE